MREPGYIRPPLVATRPPTPRQARRRVRLLLLAVAVAIVVVTYLVARALLASGEGNPSLGAATAASPGPASSLPLASG